MKLNAQTDPLEIQRKRSKHNSEFEGWVELLSLETVSLSKQFLCAVENDFLHWNSPPSYRAKAGKHSSRDTQKDIIPLNRCHVVPRYHTPRDKEP